MHIVQGILNVIWLSAEILISPPNQLGLTLKCCCACDRRDMSCEVWPTQIQIELRSAITCILQRPAPKGTYNIELSCPAASAQHQQFIQTQPVLPIYILGDGSNDLLHLPPMMAGHPSGRFTVVACLYSPRPHKGHSPPKASVSYRCSLLCYP